INAVPKLKTTMTTTPTMITMITMTITTPTMITMTITTLITTITMITTTPTTLTMIMTTTTTKNHPTNEVQCQLVHKRAAKSAPHNNKRAAKPAAKHESTKKSFFALCPLFPYTKCTSHYFI
ncbi:5961_t:CDS:2, partial [Dentiscutata erythropus]